ncbi:lipoprotein [Hoeflea sp. TYP-13]|uniref:LPS translocon maturation chaperone LptM n=1 Tax=Hoeflea sp. TYP-13 TaxID=3230023 RepID=UPI0034C614DB
MTAMNVAKAATLFMLTALLVAGCGRKGDLEIPSSQPVAENPDDTEQQPKKERRFILDPLIQ